MVIALIKTKKDNEIINRLNSLIPKRVSNSKFFDRKEYSYRDIINLLKSIKDGEKHWE